MRNKYVDIIYEERIEYFRSKAENKKIWVSLDETQDTEQRYVPNFIFGLMESDDVERGKCYLLNVATLEATNSSTISAFFLDSLTILWPKGEQEYKSTIYTYKKYVI